MVISRPAIRITARPRLRRTTELSRGLRKPTVGPSAIIPTATIKRISRILRRSISSRVCLAIAIVTILLFSSLHFGEVDVASGLPYRVDEDVFQRSPMRNDRCDLALRASHQVDDGGH